MKGEVFDNLASIRERISQAARRAGRDPAGVEVMAVVKYAPEDKVRLLLESGKIRHVGENKVQDAERRDPHGAAYHFIGHLQSNKAKKAAVLFDWIDSVDSLELAERLEREAAALGHTLNILLQVKTTRQPTQSGIEPEALGALLRAVRRLKHLDVKGLMGIAPQGTVEEIRPHFRKLKGLLDEHFAGEKAPVLSMGMSGDFEVAVEEGATLVRVGTLLFGETPRQPS